MATLTVTKPDVEIHNAQVVRPQARTNLLEAIDSPFLDPHLDYDPNESVEPHILCAKCCSISTVLKPFSTTTPWIPKRYKHYNYLIELRESAKSGCHLCTLIWCTYLEFIHGSRLDTNDYLLSTYDLMVKSEYSVLNRVYISFGEEKHRSLSHHVEVSYDDYWERERILDLARLDDPVRTRVYTASDESFRVAKSWLQKCIKSHHRCTTSKVGDTRRIFKSRALRPPELPTRLVEVGDNSSQVRLVLSARFEPLPYVTLSHCWGGTAPILTSRNIQHLCQRIDVGSVPRTFRDAILITRRLGFRYLWIDSLCILQDSKKDWQKEASLMHRVYSNSFLNIAAMWGKNGDAGCFIKRNPLAQLPCRIAGGVGKDFQLGMKTFIIKPMVREMVELDYDERPILYRAWVLQERFMSPRTLYYGARGLSWECREGETEDGASEYNWHPRNSTKADLLRLCELRERRYKPLFSSRTSLVGKIDDLTGGWHKLVWKYTTSGLTKHEDKLIALGGVMSAIEERTGLTFIAGLCKQRLLSELCWYVQYARPMGWSKPLTGVKSSLFPSWSWAACMDPVDWDSAHPDSSAEALSSFEGSEPEAQIIDASIWTERSGDMIQTKGTIRIHARLFDAQFSTNNEWANEWGAGWRILNLKHDKNTFHRSPFQIQTDVPLDAEATVYALCLYTRNPNHTPARGLLLQKLRNQNGLYERVGVWVWRRHYDGYVIPNARFEVITII